VDDPKPAPPKIGIGSPACLLLDTFGQWVLDAFGHVAYHVGSSARGKTWRDVDVRLILPDDEFAALFPGYARAHGNDARWSLLCAALSGEARRMTHLPVDFQFQPVSHSTARYSGHVRVPLLRHRSPDPDPPSTTA
jgi:hypothetical protein